MRTPSPVCLRRLYGAARPEERLRSIPPGTSQGQTQPNGPSRRIIRDCRPNGAPRPDGEPTAAAVTKRPVPLNAGIRRRVSPGLTVIVLLPSVPYRASRRTHTQRPAGSWRLRCHVRDSIGSWRGSPRCRLPWSRWRWPHVPERTRDPGRRDRPRRRPVPARQARPPSTSTDRHRPARRCRPAHHYPPPHPPFSDPRLVALAEAAVVCNFDWRQTLAARIGERAPSRPRPTRSRSRRRRLTGRTGSAPSRTANPPSARRPGPSSCRRRPTPRRSATSASR